MLPADCGPAPAPAGLGEREPIRPPPGGPEDNPPIYIPPPPRVPGDPRPPPRHPDEHGREPYPREPEEGETEPPWSTDAPFCGMY
jgi:hypothetical protein